MTPSSEARPTGGGEGSQPLSAADVASLVGGRLVGDGGRIVTGLAPLDRAGPEQLSFLAAERYAAAFARTRAGVVLVSPALESVEGPVPTRIVVEQPHDAVLALIARLHRPTPRVPGVHATAVIGRGARIGDGVSIHAYAVIGEGAVLGDRVSIGPHSYVGAGVSVGDDSELVASVTLYPGTELGRRVIVHAGARIGSDGFGYVFRDGAHQKIPHVGRCILGDDVEIGANTTVDRGSIDDTVIGAGTKVDNLVQIAHNVRIGRLCIIVSQTGIAGSVHVEDGCVIGGQVGISGHHTIGKGAKLAAQAGVFGDVPPGETWSGYPARPHREALRAQAALFKLPRMIRRLEQLAEEPTSER